MSLSLTEIADRARAGGRIALDTEFVSEDRYRALLCLVQLAVEDGEGPAIEVVDALASADPAPIAAVLADPEVEVVVHSGRQDIAILRRTWGVQVRNVFDTQVAAAFAGASIQASYETLLSQFLGIPVAKSATFTRWDRRPLTAEQLAYAHEDVEHLLELAAALRNKLAEGGRLEWAREECRQLEDASDERDPESIFRRLPKVATLNETGAAVARELALWREQTAQTADRPARSVLADASLVEVARRRPRSTRELADIRGMREQAVRRHGSDILETVRRGEQAPPVKLERGRPPQEESGPLVALAEALVRSRAQDAELAHQLIASRDELSRIVSASVDGQQEPEVRALHGWRRELVGAELLELLSGRRSLSVSEHGGLRSEPA
jgi:ribonuclease D